MGKNRVAAVAAAFVLAVSVSACGGGSDKSDSTLDTVVEPTGQPATGDPIVVGTICSCSGALASSQGSLPKVIDAWVEFTNANGGINGHPVKVVKKDDALTPAKSLQAVKELIEEDKVVAIIADVTPLDATWADYVASKGVPVVGGTPAQAPFYTNDDFYPSGTVAIGGNIGSVIAAKDAGLKHMGGTYAVEAPTALDYNNQLDAIADAAGIGYDGQSIAATAPNYTSACLAMKNKGVDVLNLLHAADVNVRVMRDCASLGFKPTALIEAGSLNATLQKDPNVNNALYIGLNANLTDTSIPGVKNFIGALNKFAPGVATSDQFNDNAMFVWAGAELFRVAAEAGKLTPTSTSADVKAALGTLKDETLDGLSAPLTFSAGKDSFTKCVFVNKIENGDVVSQNDGKPVCVEDADLARYLDAVKSN